MSRDRESRGFRLPAGVGDKQRIQALEDRMVLLERRIVALEEGDDEEKAPEFAALVDEALALRVLTPKGKPASRSVLERWAPERLAEAIAAAKG